MTTPGTKPKAAELLDTPSALLTRTHLRELGLERRAIDAIFGRLPTIIVPGYSRPMVRVADYQALMADSVYDGRTKVRS